MHTARFRALRYASWLLAGALLVTAQGAWAENPADKATARKLATEGIELYQAGKYSEALDKLERAEALYDAPVHLLYIARAQSALNRWVEAAETYRKLVRVKLEPGAPDAFQQAIDDGKKELAELEPKIPSLKVEVSPAAPGLEVRIDGEVVSSAALGVDRPINPGDHRVTASAPGYRASEQQVTVTEGEKGSVALELVQGAGAPEPAAKKGQTKAVPSTQKSPKKLGLFVGVRLLAAIPAGTAGSAELATGTETKFSMSDVMGAGGGLELQGGLTFARYFAGKVYLDLYNMTPGDRVEDNGRVSGVDFGFGLHAGTEPHRFGGFGEIGIGLLHDFEWHDELEIGNAKVSRDITLKGAPSLRIGGGAIIPLGKYFHITPFMLASFAQFTKTAIKIDSSSPLISDSDESRDIPESNRGGHQLFLLGVGGDWLIGG